MAIEHRRETEWDSLALVVESRDSYWQFFVYDQVNCEILYHGKRYTEAAAKEATIEFVVINNYGSDKRLKPEALSEMLSWSETTVEH